MNKLFFIAGLSCFLYACIKAPIPIADNTNTSDPNISFYDNYKVEISTYKIDSFITSGSSTFAIGYHKDSLFGTINASSYVQVNLPDDNPIKNKNVTFDSLVLMLKPSGDYYGDTVLPFKIQVHRLLQKISNDDDDNSNFYNPRKFLFDTTALGNYTSFVKPKKGSNITIRLDNVLGQELLLKLKNNNIDIQENTNFLNYFKGILFKTDTAISKTLFHFKLEAANIFLRLHYHLNGTFSEEKFIDFPMLTSRQFNHLDYKHDGTNLSVFTAFKNQLKKSNQTGNKAYLHNNMASYIKINFPTILELKEIYPYVKVMKAELVITASPGTYRYPYQLPRSLYLFATDDNNGLNYQITDNFGQAPLTGNLFIDELYGDKTNYSYDITNYINTLLQEGRFSKSALMLTPSASASGELQRLVINDQTQSKSIKLKLYLLGL